MNIISLMAGCRAWLRNGNNHGRLAAAGYDMIGIDVSPDMLEIANEEKECEWFLIHYVSPAGYVFL